MRIEGLTEERQQTKQERMHKHKNRERRKEGKTEQSKFKSDEKAVRVVVDVVTARIS
jgi:hypothetical protein